MDFDVLKRMERVFGPSDVRYKEDFTNRAYEELIADLNILSRTIYEQILENRKPLESIAIALDFMVRRIESKQRLIRSCLEMDLIIQNANRPIMMIDEDGDINA